MTPLPGASVEPAPSTSYVPGVVQVSEPPVTDGFVGALRSMRTVAWIVF